MGHYLSNGTMGDMWMSEWCYRCQNDHDFSHGSDWGESDQGCEILLRLYLDEHPIPELIDHSDEHDYSEGWSPRWLECRMFTPCQKCDPGGGDGDQPKPVDPGPDHGVLFEVIDETPATPMLIIPLADESVLSEATS